MDTQVIVLSVVADIVGLVSVILGFVAEKTKIKPSEIIVNDFVYCDYPTSSVLGMAISASLMLILAEVLIAIAGSCCGCCRTNAAGTGKSVVGIVLSVFSWFAFTTSFILFLVGAVNRGVNWQHLKIGDDCPLSSHLPGIFAGAAVLAFVAVSLGTAAAFLLAATPGSSSQYAQGVEMGRPQFQVPSNGTPPFNRPTI
ncbi:uncharacterized protein [Typha angustifolia]|uniref:uncharacterized protein n=1 Tax=Typha angustifolia TaxID=59011 RepID=UPI003C2B11B5